MLLLALAVGVGLSGGRQVITVDTRRRLVTLEHHGRLGSRRTVALFLGFFEGDHSRTAMQARCERLRGCLRAGGTAAP